MITTDDIYAFSSTTILLHRGCPHGVSTIPRSHTMIRPSASGRVIVDCIYTLSTGECDLNFEREKACPLLLD